MTDDVHRPTHAADSETPASGDANQPDEQKMRDDLAMIRGILERHERRSRYTEFSLAPAIAAVAQILAAAALVWALADWIFAAAPAQVLIKLGFAIALQVIALTAVMSQTHRK
jgi:hypothetical protein